MRSLCHREELSLSSVYTILLLQKTLRYSLFYTYAKIYFEIERKSVLILYIAQFSLKKVNFTLYLSGAELLHRFYSIWLGYCSIVIWFHHISLGSFNEWVVSISKQILITLQSGSTLSFFDIFQEIPPRR